MATISNREEEILRTLVELSEDMSDPVFEIAGEDRLPSPPWPQGPAAPSKSEIRKLVTRGYLEVDRGAAPAWRFWPSARARELHSSPNGQRLADALRDPDQRLAVALKGIVDAFERDPSTPLLLIGTNSVHLIRHPAWVLPPEVFRLHDLRQLEDLGLIGWEDDTQFYPTPAGRMAVRNPAALLAQRADEASDDEERSRLKSWSEKVRAGDVAVGTASGVTGAVIRALLGF